MAQDLTPLFFNTKRKHTEEGTKSSNDKNSGFHLDFQCREEQFSGLWKSRLIETNSGKNSSSSMQGFDTEGSYPEKAAPQIVLGRTGRQIHLLQNKSAKIIKKEKTKPTIMFIQEKAIKFHLLRRCFQTIPPSLVQCICLLSSSSSSSDSPTTAAARMVVLLSTNFC